MKNANLSLKGSTAQFKELGQKIRPYLGVLLFLLFALTYAYLVLKINTLSNPQIDSSTVASEGGTTSVTRIDLEAIKQLETLQDNSVNVQTLFEEGRTNPFQE